MGQRREGTLIVRAGGVWLWLQQGNPARRHSPLIPPHPHRLPSVACRPGVGPGRQESRRIIWPLVAPPRRRTNRLKGATAFAPPHSDYFTNRTQTGVGTLRGLPVSFNRPVAWSIANT